MTVLVLLQRLVLHAYRLPEKQALSLVFFTCCLSDFCQPFIQDFLVCSRLKNTPQQLAESQNNVRNHLTFLKKNQLKEFNPPNPQSTAI